MVNKFNEHLLELSHNKYLSSAKEEWFTIYEEKRKTQDRLCICQHKIKNVIYMHNTTTNRSICVGTGCCKKFDFHTKKSKNNALNTVFNRIYQGGEYEIIDDIIQYSDDIQHELIKHFIKECKKNKHNEFDLFEIQSEIEDLITNHKMTYLQNIHTSIKKKIKEIKKRKQQKKIQILYEQRMDDIQQKTTEYMKNILEELHTYFIKQQQIQEELIRKNEEHLENIQKNTIIILKNVLDEFKQHVQQQQQCLLFKQITEFNNKNIENILNQILYMEPPR